MGDDDAADEPQGPIGQIQSILASLDPSAMVLGFATVVEWLEEDGTRSMSLIATDAAPWHLQGMLTYAVENHVYERNQIVFLADDDDFDED